MLETLDWRMVTASPIDGFLLTIAEALNPLWAMFTIVWCCAYLETSLDNIFLQQKIIFLFTYYKFGCGLHSGKS